MAHPLILARELISRYALPSGDRQIALDALDRLCESADDDLRHCKDCGETFVLAEATRAWYFERHMAEPVRCQLCRDQRRVQAR